MEYLNSQGIYPGVHYRDNTNYEIYSDQKGACPISYTLSEEVISLPLHMRLVEDDVNYVIEKVIEAIKIFN